MFKIEPDTVSSSGPHLRQSLPASLRGNHGRRLKHRHIEVLLRPADGADGCKIGPAVLQEKLGQDESTENGGKRGVTPPPAAAAAPVTGPGQKVGGQKKGAALRSGRDPGQRPPQHPLRVRHGVLPHRVLQAERQRIRRWKPLLHNRAHNRPVGVGRAVEQCSHVISSQLASHAHPLLPSDQRPASAGHLWALL